jgi:5,10-methylenetetrahydromethanopterin reductase
MKFSVRFNNDLPVADYPALAQAAEQAGFDQFWVSDDLFLRGVWPILSACALATNQIGLGTCIVNPYTMHPAEMAMQAVALDELSDGRFHLGIAAGAADFLGWIGIPQTKPLTFTSETITVLRRLFAGERVAFNGQQLNGWGHEAYLRVPARPIPIYLGAMSTGMLELIGSAADGGLPLLFPPEHFGEVWQIVQEGAAKAKRDPNTLDLAACIWVSVAEDREAAEQALRAKIAYYGHALSDLILARLGLTRADFVEIEHAVQHDHDLERAKALVTPAMLQIGMVGSGRDLLPRLEGLIQAGAHHLSFGPPLGPDPYEALRVLGREVLPALRDTNNA